MCMSEGIRHLRPTTMHQRSFATAEFALKKKRTRREVFLAEMAHVVLGGGTCRRMRTSYTSPRSAIEHVPPRPTTM